MVRDSQLQDRHRSNHVKRTENTGHEQGSQRQAVSGGEGEGNDRQTEQETARQHDHSGVAASLQLAHDERTEDGANSDHREHQPQPLGTHLKPLREERHQLHVLPSKKVAGVGERNEHREHRVPGDELHTLHQVAHHTAPRGGSLNWRLEGKQDQHHCSKPRRAAHEHGARPKQPDQQARDGWRNHPRPLPQH